MRIPPHVQPEVDTRPRCVLVIGNGVSIDFLETFKLSKRVNVQSIIPPPSWVQELEIPMTGSAVVKPLWSEERYPELFLSWQRYFGSTDSATFQGFCEFGKNEWAFDRPDSNHLTQQYPSFSTRSAAMQLRYYLWHLFVTYDKEVRENLNVDLHQLMQWKWTKLLLELHLRFRLTVVSYNYDFFVEPIFRDLGIDYYVPAHNCVQHWIVRDINEVCILKPHGCIAHVSQHIGGGESAGLMIVQNFSAPSFSKFVYPPTENCPSLPDLVPPGHYKDHYANSISGVENAVDIAFRDCDVLICGGFSAAGPDKREFAGYCDKLNRVQNLAAIGLKRFNDDKNDASNILKAIAEKRGAQFSFFDSEEILTFPSWIDSCNLKKRVATNRYEYFRELTPEIFPKLALQKSHRFF